MAWPISLGSFPLFAFPNSDFRRLPSVSACQHVSVSAFAPDISAFAFPLSGAHSPHGEPEENSCKKSESMCIARGLAALPRQWQWLAQQTPVHDLFCGIGGFRFAFERAGCECVFSCDWNEKARETYKANFGEEPHGDIHAIAVADIPEHDILCAGFPCQPFSIAGVSKKLSLGRATGFDDKEQGNLFFSLADIIEYHQPAAFVLENVKNLRSHDQGRTFQIIMQTLEEHLGYRVYPKVIDAQTVVPQHRERIFLVGFKERRDFEFPQFPAEGPKLNSIFENDVPDKYTLTDHLWQYLQDYAAKHRAAGNGFGFGLVNGNQIARTLSARYYKDGSEILISQGAGKNPRRLTPRECAKLMGYPASFKIPVSDTQAYKQFGNSVVVPVVERIARRVVETLQRPVDYRQNLVLELAERKNRTLSLKPKPPAKPVRYKIARKSK
jgi:DNA (cytosine-5)-methyltransferase 1